VLEEIEANRFAAEILMPETLLSQKIAGFELEYVDESNDRELTKLAKDFDVSKQALSIRLSALVG
jgi:Zn-dependent peptidase ImmA (M78 family)